MTKSIVAAGAAQRADQLAQQREGVLERRQIGDLAADMHMHAVGHDPRQRGGLAVERGGLLERHAEFVLGAAGGDLVMGLGVDIRVHAHGDAGLAPLGFGHFAQGAKLGLQFHVEGEDAGVEREGHLLLGLADAGEGDAVGRHIHRERAAQLAFGHHIHAGAEPRQGGEHAEIGVGLDRVADERVRGRGEGFGEHPVVALKRRRRIAIEGRADRVRERAQIDLLGM